MSISQMISKPEYEALKEYWDFQRVIEYNKEKLLQGLRDVAKKPFAPKEVDPETMFELIWNQMKEDDKLVWLGFSLGVPTGLLLAVLIYSAL